MTLNFKRSLQFIGGFFALLMLFQQAWNFVRIWQNKSSVEYDSYTPKPYVEYQAPSNFTSKVESTNEEGFRNEPIAITKQKGTTRIAFFATSIGRNGDSNSGTIAKNMEKLLNNSAHKTEVINASFQSYVTSQILLTYFLKVYKYKPDIVVVMGAKNDFNVAGGEDRPGYPYAFALRENSKAVLDNFFGLSVPIFLVGKFSVLGEINPTLSRGRLLENLQIVPRQVKSPQIYTEYLPYIAKVVENYEKIMLLNQTLNAVGLFIVEPRSRYSDIEKKVFEKMHKDLQTVALKYPKQYVENLEYLESRLNFKDGFHWQNSQNVIVAEEILQKLKFNLSKD